MAAQSGEDVYVTVCAMWIAKRIPINTSPWGRRVRATPLTIDLQQLLLSDTYLPGALVLAHSLRDAGTTKKLAVLVTLDTVAAEVVTQLEASCFPVPRDTPLRPSN